jgi:hypothetical protein
LRLLERIEHPQIRSLQEWRIREISNYTEFAHSTKLQFPKSNRSQHLQK